MRIAVISDIHGNLAALEAVIADLRDASPDLTVHGGDLVMHGSHPAQVMDRLRELGWPGVVGNTDEVLWRPDRLDEQAAKAPKILPILQMVFEELAPATATLLGPDRVDWLRALPAEWRHDGLTVLHASPGDLWRAPTPDAADQVFLDTYGSSGTTVVYGHIHRPFVRALPGLTVANSGSVGMPYDGDWRASYFLMTDGRAEIRRVEYDLDKELAHLRASGYPRADWLAEVRRRGAYTPPY